MEQPTKVPAHPSSPPVWRCPECGVIFVPQPTTVRCPQCGENLRKCRYCQYADTATWECTNQRIRFTFGDEFGRYHIPEPDHVWACPENRPALHPTPWQMVLANPLLRALAWGAGTAVVLFLVFRFIVLPLIVGPPVPESALLSLQTAVPSQVMLGDPIHITVTFTNGEQNPLNQWVLVLRGSLVTNAEPPQVTPNPIVPPEFIGDSVRLYFAGLAPQQQMTVNITLQPKEMQRRIYNLEVDAYGYFGAPGQPLAMYRAFVLPTRRFQVRVR